MEGRTAKKPRGGAHNRQYGGDVRDAIVSAQESDAVLRLQDIRDTVQRDHRNVPSIPSISRILLQEGYTTKKVQQYANDRSTPATKEKRAVWCRDVGSTLTDTAIFVDETPFSFCIMRTRGRSRKGETAVGVVPGIHGRNHSVIAAMSPSHGLVYYEIKVTQPEEEFVRKRSSKKKKTGPRGVTRDVFRMFLINLLALPLFNSGTEFTILFDNARIHQGDIDETIFQAGHHHQFLAAWSPELNPIEYMFSKWKLAYRVLYPATEEAVDEAIKQSASVIKPQDCKKYFEHTQHLYARALAHQDL